MEYRETPVNPTTNEDGIGSRAETAAENPLSEVEADLFRLMNANGRLEHELAELRDKSESDMRNLLLDIVSLADSFGNALNNIEPRLDGADQQTRIWINNFKTIFKLLNRIITSWGVAPVEALIGHKVNPYWHNVAEVEENPDREDETIVEVIKRGYMWNGKLLRPAEVRAVKNG